jgi:site-specific DNA recombinase
VFRNASANAVRPRPATHSYAFKSRLLHKSCGRRMQGNWANDEAYYRCRYLNEYAIANKVDHPLNVYLREANLKESVDHWLAQTFSAPLIEHVLTTMEESQPGEDMEAQALRRVIAECDRKLAQHRAVAEAGGDPALVASWSREVQAERITAQVRLAQIGENDTAPRRLARDEISGLVNAMGGLLSVLSKADPADSAEVYRQLGLTSPTTTKRKRCWPRRSQHPCA